MDLAHGQCHDENRKGSSPNCCHKGGSTLKYCAGWIIKMEHTEPWKSAFRTRGHILLATCCIYELCLFYLLHNMFFFSVSKENWYIWNAIWFGFIDFFLFLSHGTQSFTPYMHTHTHTNMLTHLHSTSIHWGFSHISEGDKGRRAFFPAVGIYVVSLFNLIASKTSGGRRAFSEWRVPAKHPSHVYTHTHTACTLCSVLTCTDNIKDAVTKRMRIVYAECIHVVID